jgi:hypothetical protein
LAYDPRPFITVTNELFRHPKFTGLPSDKARLCLLELWAHCNEFKTDGIVPKHVLNAKGAAVGKALIAAGWVETTPDKDMFLMHDYLDHQKSKAELEELRDNRKKSAGYGLHVRWHAKRGVVEQECDYCRDSA